MTIHKKNSQVEFNNILKRIVYYDPEGFIAGMPVWSNMQKSIDVVHHINKMRDKSHLIITINTKLFNMNQY